MLWVVFFELEVVPFELSGPEGGVLFHTRASSSSATNQAGLLSGIYVTSFLMSDASNLAFEVAAATGSAIWYIPRGSFRKSL